MYGLAKTRAARETWGAKSREPTEGLFAKRAEFPVVHDVSYREPPGDPQQSTQPRSAPSLPEMGRQPHAGPAQVVWVEPEGD